MTRRVTDEQFSQGTTVDGTRIDKALEDTFNYYNNIPVGAIANRMVTQRVVAGWEPANIIDAADVGANRYKRRLYGPFLRGYNDTYDPLTIKTTPTRFKGLDIERINNSIYYPLAWSIKLQNPRPVIIDGASAILHIDANSIYYLNALKWLRATGTENINDLVRDIHFQADVFSPYSKTDPMLSSVVFHKFRMPVNSIRFIIAAPGAFTDMLPAFPAGFPSGLAIWAQGLAIPIPANSTLRISLILPIYPVIVGELTSWDEDPVRHQAYSMTLTLLEEMRD